MLSSVLALEPCADAEAADTEAGGDTEAADTDVLEAADTDVLVAADTGVLVTADTETADTDHFFPQYPGSAGRQEYTQRYRSAIQDAQSRPA